MKKRQASTFCIPNVSLLRRLRDKESFTLDKTINMKTLDLDSFAQREKIKYIDFMKSDAEGCELDILKGSKKFLENSILGLSLEIQFNNLFADGPLFGEIDSFLRKFGFQLFDLGLVRLKRKALSFELGPSDFGQLIPGHALYLKDQVEKIETNEGKNWNEQRILKMIGIMELYNLPDCAIELAQAAKKYGYFKKLNTNKIVDLLTPEMDGKILPYRNYLLKLKKRQKHKGYYLSRLLRFFISAVPLKQRTLIKQLLFQNN